MANTYTQIYIHIIFAVKHRQALLNPKWDTQLHNYMSGIVQLKGQKMMAIDGVQDHIHMLIGLQPECSVSELVREIKKSSTKYINENRLTLGKFQWQSGFGAFSVSTRGVDQVCKYIKRQKEHHHAVSFGEEYVRMLEVNGVEYKKEYLFLSLV